MTKYLLEIVVVAALKMIETTGRFDQYDALTVRKKLEPAVIVFHHG